MAETHTLSALAQQLPGAALGITLDGPRIVVPGAPGMDVPQTGKGWMRHEAPTVWPNIPHGDARPTLLFGILKDSGAPNSQAPLDGQLWNALEEQLPGDSRQQRKVLAAAMRAKFWTTAGNGRTRATSADSKRFLLPLHATLPMSFRQEKAEGGETAFRYKMFRGTVLPFLLSGTDGHADELLLRELLEVFTSDDDLTVLDREVLQIAQKIAPSEAQLDPGFLIATSGDVLDRMRSAGGGFCGPSLEQFRSDLRLVLTMSLPRRDLIHQITLLLSLHLATRLYRAAMILSLQLDACTALYTPDRTDSGEPSCGQGCCGSSANCDLAGRMRFRTGSGTFRPVKLTDPCVASYRDLTSNYLLPLPVTISTVNIAADALRAAGGAALPPCDPVGLRNELAADAALRSRFDAVTRLLAAARVHQLRGNAEELAEPASLRLPGLHTLRMALLEGRRSTMRREGREVVHQLAKEVRAGRLISSNGNAAVFFELDEDMIHLLVRITCGNELIPYREFLARLRRYGLHPQHRDEELILQQALARLGMLERYSDAAESAYVRYPDTDTDDEEQDA